jgi:hypothetical protein
VWCESVVARSWQVRHVKTAKFRGFVWQAEQGFPACAPDVMGNHTWLKVPCSHEASEAL